MPKGSSAAATTAADSANTISSGESANADALYGTLAPTLEAQVAAPEGIDPTTMAEMNTEALQTAGGSQAGAVGQGALQDARTRNAGGADAAIAKSSRTAGETASKGVLGNQLASERLKQQERQSGEAGLEGLFNSQTGASVNSLGEVASNVNADANAENASWDWMRYGVDPLLQAAGSAAPTIGKAFGV